MEILIETNDTTPFNNAGLYYAKPIDMAKFESFIIKLILSYRLHSHLDYSEEIGESTAKRIASAIISKLQAEA